MSFFDYYYTINRYDYSNDEYGIQLKKVYLILLKKF